MADIELVIKIPEGLKNDFESEQWTALSCIKMKDALEKATQLPKGHGRIVDIGTLLPKGCGRMVDISKLDKNMIETSASSIAPVIGLIIGGECIEVVSLDYLGDLKPIIEADKAESEEEEYDR